MNNLLIKETKYTPYINLDFEKNLIMIKGKSYPENTYDFYKPMLDWIEEFIEQKSSTEIVIDIDIIYFNSSSSKLFFDFFDIIEEAQADDFKIKINWYYDEDNEGALEDGEDFKEDFEDLDFILIKK